MIELRHLDTLIPYARNSRTHSERQVEQLAASIDEFGLVGAVVVRDGTIAKGHGTLQAVRKLDKPAKSETGHSTQKPVECMAIPMRNNSQPGDAVYEPFSGSGTTIIAGENLGRKVRAIEISPAYVAVALQRWADHTGNTPFRI